MYLAALAVGYYADKKAIAHNMAQDRVFRPAIETAQREKLLAGWKEAVQRSLGWEK